MTNKDMIFVFGSNLAGRHGKGAALFALRNHGAIYGQGLGRQGNSYAIPTKDWDLRTLPLPAIGMYVHNFFKYTRGWPEDSFELTPIGTGLAGYSKDEIWNLIEPHYGVPSVRLSDSWFSDGWRIP